MQISRLLDPQVWLDAACQIFFSFSLAFGGLVAFASYNPETYNSKRDVLAVSACNVGTALFAGSIIFSILGYKAFDMFNVCVTGYSILLSPLLSHPSSYSPSQNLQQDFFNYSLLVSTH